MAFLEVLWLPILISAVFVFVVSSVIHMLLPYHRNDFAKVPDEAGLQEALRKFGLPPGDYVVPCAGSAKGMRAPEYVDKLNKGPVLLMTVLPTGQPKMAGSLILWFLYGVLVSFCSAYIAFHALGPGAHYLAVFRFVGAAAFMGYALALLQNSIWYNRKWCSTLKSMFDGLIYALVTAGTFGWLWPMS